MYKVEGKIEDTPKEVSLWETSLFAYNFYHRYITSGKYNEVILYKSKWFRRGWKVVERWSHK